MKTYELCQTIRRAMLLRAAEAMTYKSWSDEFATSRLRDFPEHFAEWEEFAPVDPTALTAEQMDDLGFGLWSKENPIRLIPLWLLPFLDGDVQTESINGKGQTIREAKEDDDHRYGCVAFGVFPLDSVTA